MTPTLSEAEAEMVMVPETVAPFKGDVMEVVGGVVSELAVTVTLTTEENPLLPAASYALVQID